MRSLYGTVTFPARVLLAQRQLSVRLEARRLDVDGLVAQIDAARLSSAAFWNSRRERVTHRMPEQHQPPGKPHHSRARDPAPP